MTRLATRIGKLEQRYPPPVPGCGRCLGHVVLCDREITRVEVGGRSAPACAACGNLLRGPVKVIVGIDAGAL